MVVPALGDPRRERPPAVYGHVINVPTTQCAILSDARSYPTFPYIALLHV